MTDDEIITEILKREGGLVSHPADRGGPTNRGITLSTLSQWLGRPVEEAEIRDLSEADARAIYREVYITKPGFNAIATDSRLRALVIDCGVNHGISPAVKLLQRAVGVRDDGVFGPKTKEAVRNADLDRLYAKVCAERVRYYGRIITNNPSQAVFAAGWLNRAAEFIEQA